MTDDVLIIGAGIAGLSTGCYAQMNGYRSRIVELHTLPGGLCTAWKRKGYTFDGCIHWLVGTRPGGNGNDVWTELGALKGRTIFDPPEFRRLIDPDGKELVFHADADRLRAHLIELAPGDRKEIERFTRDIKRLSRMAWPDKAPELMGLLDKLRMFWRMLPTMPAMNRYGKLLGSEYFAQYSDPFVRRALHGVLPIPEFPAVALLFALAFQHDRNGGYPLGGSLAFSQAIEQRYLGLGGEIQYRARVEEILVEGGRAVGVRTADGEELRADTVVSAADGRSTIFDMLKGTYATDTVRGYYDRMPIFKPMVQVSLGVDRDLSGTPHHVTYLLDEPLGIPGETGPTLNVHHYADDPSMAPPGKTSIVSLHECDYEPWAELARDRARYDEAKQRAADTIVAAIDQRMPGLAAAVEVVDVATPLTTERYTGNWKGSIEGWLVTPETMAMMVTGGMSKTLPGLDRFYMVGQWVEPGGGVSTAAQSGRNVVQLLCHRDRRSFVTTTA